MAITPSVFQSSSNLGGSPLQDSFTTVSGDTYLVVFVAPYSGTITGVTFNSVAMTLVTSQTQTNIGYTYVLASPSIGAYNITFSLSGGTNVAYVAGSYQGTQTVSVPSNIKSSNASSAGLTLSGTTNFGRNVMGVYAFKSGGSPTISASTGSTVRTTATDSNRAIALFDSNATTGYGSQSMAFTNTSASEVIAILATLPENALSTYSDTNVTTDSVTYDMGFTISDTNVTTDSFEFSKWNNQSKNSTTWTNEQKS